MYTRTTLRSKSVPQDVVQFSLDHDDEHATIDLEFIRNCALIGYNNINPKLCHSDQGLTYNALFLVLARFRYGDGSRSEERNLRDCEAQHPKQISRGLFKYSVEVNTSCANRQEPNRNKNNIRPNSPFVYGRPCA